MSLNASQERHVDAASREGLLRALARVRRFVGQRRWLGPRNSYVPHPTEFIEASALGKEIPAPPPAPRQLAEYIAASGPWHSIDGWAYLGRAFEALMQGDSVSALHLGYYAELRAAISLLASQGIGIFDKRHFILADDGTPVSLGSRRRTLGTHQMAWEVLEYWATRAKAVDLLSDVVRPFAAPLSDWFSGTLATPAALAPTASYWLRTVGVDLSILPLDRVARNRASYHASGLRPEGPRAVDEALDFVVETWRLLEPTSGWGFEQLDQHFVKAILRRTHNSLYGGTNHAVTFEAFAASAADGAVGATLARPTIDAYLTNNAEDVRVIALARERPGSTAAPDDLQVIARAALLLRISTGAWRRLFHDADIPVERLAFSWSPFARDRGLIPNGTILASCTDLWSEIQSALDDVEEWRRSTPEARDRSRYNFRRDCAASLTMLTRCECVGLWGLA